MKVKPDFVRTDFAELKQKLLLQKFSAYMEVLFSINKNSLLVDFCFLYRSQIFKLFYISYIYI